MIDVIIPTVKTPEEIFPLQVKITEKSGNVRVIPVCSHESAARNRNTGLNLATSEYVIMVDDDIDGFFSGWATMLVENFTKYSDIMLVSARLIKPSGANAIMMGSIYDTKSEFEIVNEKHVPSACIAFRRPKLLRFDEGFLGSGFEDTWFCDCLAMAYPEGRVIIDNRVRLIHRNEQKNQVRNFNHNSSYYEELKANARKD